MKGFPFELPFCAALALWAGLSSVAAPGARFFVHAQRGSDENPGTAERPFATPTRARDAVRELKRSGAFPKGGVAVELAGRFETRGAPILELGEEDGGPFPQAPVTWCAAREGAILSGACRLAAADFRPVAGEARARLRPEARGKVLQCDLAKAGIPPFEPLPAQFVQWPGPELFAAGRAMTPARYPNRGWLEIETVLDRGVGAPDASGDEWQHGERGGTFACPDAAPERWDVKTGVYLFGYWCHDWASGSLRVADIDRTKKTIRLEGVHAYGLGKKEGRQARPRRYYAYNLLEELDAPGEWYVDRPSRRLYFYPTAAGVSDVAISLAEEPLLRLHGVRNLLVKGLDFRFSSGLAVEAEDCENLLFYGLTVAWFTRDAVRISGGAACTVRACRISDVGGTGLSVTGGNRRTLEKCRHRVVDSDIGFCGRLSRTGGRCLRFGGCGVIVDRNSFHDTPYSTVHYGGNEHLFQCNEIACSMLEAGDGGGLYTGRDWGSRGTVVRWNYFHHFGREGVELRAAEGHPSDCEPLKDNVMVEGLYLDDCDSGETVYGNIFFRAGRAMFTGGGRDNKWRHNLAIDCEAAAHVDTRGLQRAKPGSGIRNGWDLLARIKSLGYTQEPWASRYPELLGVMEKEPLLPIGTEYISNVAVRCGRFFDTSGSAMKFIQDRMPCCGNVSYDARLAKRDEERFPQKDAALKTKLALRSQSALTAAAVRDPLGFQDTPAFRAAFPNFPRIPVEEIGPRQKR